MRTFLVLVLFLVLPFLNGYHSGSCRLSAQQEELMEEESTKKSESPKKEVKKEVKQEIKKEESKEIKKEEPKDSIPNVNKQPEVQIEVHQTPELKIADQDEEKVNMELPERLRYYKEKYEYKFDKPFEIVWNSVKKSLEDLGCMIATENYKASDEGLYKGIIKSDFCVFTAGKDTTFKTLTKYSYDLPVIRGGIWLNGRMQYTFIVKEEAGGGVYLQVKGEMSGYEDFVTHEVHFWKSNGMFETRVVKLIRKNFDVVLKK